MKPEQQMDYLIRVCAATTDTARYNILAEYELAKQSEIRTSKYLSEMYERSLRDRVSFIKLQRQRSWWKKLLGIYVEKKAD